MKVRRITGMRLLAITAAFACLAGCGGGGSNQISITLTTPGGILSVDESQTNVSPTLIFTAAVGGDTANKGVTWDLKKQTSCSGTGTGAGQCGNLSNQSPTQVTYTPPGGLSAELSVTLTATSVTDSSVTKTATIKVELPPTFTLTSCNPPSPPANSPCVLPEGKNGVPYISSGSNAITIAFTGGVPPYSFNQPTLPPCLNMTVSTTGLTATVSGTPCGSTQGVPVTTTFTVIVTDSGGAPAVGQLYSITIDPPPPLQVVTNSLPEGFTNTLYSTSVVAQGGVPPLTWSMTPAPATSLPPGLSFNTSTGLISGIPTSAAPTGSSCSPAVAGKYCFTVQVTDSALIPNPAPPNFAHQVAPPAPLPLSITIQNPPPLQITTASLPAAVTATGYSGPLHATGGIAPYTWSITQGQLPAGLTLSTQNDGTGSISGMPILEGSSTFTVQVADSEAVPAVKQAQYTITVTANADNSNNNELLQGSYAFLFRGFDKDGLVLILGTITADGKGNITAGVEDVNRLSGVALGATVSGTYSLGPDGRGTLELVAVFAKQGTLTTDYDLVLDSSGGARFFEDNSTAKSSDKTDGFNTHGEASMKPVLSSSFTSASFAGNYSFVFPGQDIAGKQAALGGVIHANGSSATLTPGSGDFNDAGTFSSGSLSGEFSSVSGNRGAAELTFPITNGQMTLNFVFHFVSPSDIFFVESDSSTTTGLPTVARLGGEMILQQPTTIFNSTVLQGTSVVSGTGLSGSNSDVFAGLLTATTCDGTTPTTLSYDENNGGTITSPSSPGTCTMGLNGNGRAAFAYTGFTAAQARVAAAYLTGPGQGFFMGSDAAVTTGSLEQQSGGPFADASVLGSYALGAPQVVETQVPNVIGQVVGDGAGNLSGVVDETDPPATAAPNLAQAFTASFSSLAATGRGTLTTTGTVPKGIPPTGIFYIVSPTKFRMISSSASDQHPNLLFLDH